MTHRTFAIVALAGIVAGCLDLAYAFVWFGPRVTPTRIMQSIATGVLGRDAYSGGDATVLLGAVLHFSICIVAASVFYAASLRFPWLASHVVIAGAVFGLGLYVVMNFVVVPLSAFPHKGDSPPSTIVTGVLVHMFLVGVPIAFGARRAGRAHLSPSMP